MNSSANVREGLPPSVSAKGCVCEVQCVSKGAMKQEKRVRLGVIYLLYIPTSSWIASPECT